MKAEIIISAYDENIIGVISMEIPAVPRQGEEIVFSEDAGPVIISSWEGGESHTFDNQGGDRRYLKVTKVIWEVRVKEVIPVICAEVDVEDVDTRVVLSAAVYPQKIFATTTDGRYVMYASATWKGKELSPIPDDDEYGNILWEGQDTWTCLANGKEKTVPVKEIEFKKTI